MKNVKVLGGGCSKCIILAEEVKKAADELGIEIELEKITDFKQIMRAQGDMANHHLIANFGA